MAPKRSGRVPMRSLLNHRSPTMTPMDTIYLDNNATTRPAPEVVAVMDEALRELWANPSSVHRFGQRVRQRMELARADVAALIGARPRDLILTSGGTESNNLALGGLSPDVLITTPIEHAAIQEPVEAMEQGGTRVVRLAVDGDGVADPAVLGEALADPALRRALEAGVGGATVLISVQWANNETGVLQPIAELAAAVEQVRSEAREAGERLKIVLHSDATQAVGKVPVDVESAGLDLMTFAGHKFHGPKGAGALWVRRGVRLRPLVRGGPQEREKRGGTENVPAILGLGVAATLAQAFLGDEQAIAKQTALRDRLELAICAALPETVVNGGGAARLWNTSNLGFPGLEAEAILLGLSERGVCASAGAACSSGSLDPSPVLLAMGVPEPVAHGSVRLSLSRETTADEIDRAIALIPEVVERLGRTMPMA